MTIRGVYPCLQIERTNRGVVLHKVCVLQICASLNGARHKNFKGPLCHSIARS